MDAGIPERRMHNQYVTRSRRGGPADLVAWMGAVQAQEFPAAKWGLGLRLPARTTDGEIERAFADGHILRTHVMRPTWHFVTPADIRWMLELTAPRVHRIAASYNRRMELDTATLIRSAGEFERALAGRQHLTRAELAVHLQRAGLAARGMRLALLTMYAELEGVICSGPRRETRFTYALLSERAPGAKRLSRDEALAELTRRYFRSHGPCTIRDFVWWSGLTSAEAKRGLEMIAARHEAVDGLTYWSIEGRRGTHAKRGTVHLLPIYDEYLVAYRDRAAVPHGPRVPPASPAGVTFQHALVIDGQIAGTWRTSRTLNAPRVDVVPLRRLTRPERRALADALTRYERFLGIAVSTSIA